jgi:hypothetical protein
MHAVCLVECIGRSKGSAAEALKLMEQRYTVSMQKWEEKKQRLLDQRRQHLIDVYNAYGAPTTSYGLTSVTTP